MFLVHRSVHILVNFYCKNITRKNKRAVALDVYTYTSLFRYLYAYSTVIYLNSLILKFSFSSDDSGRVKSTYCPTKTNMG
jgi:hypothetical protein